MNLGGFKKQLLKKVYRQGVMAIYFCLSAAAFSDVPSLDQILGMFKSCCFLKPDRLPEAIINIDS
jgi:hypothetical protein